jgi:2,4-dienoyl-CoA reductase-like NADH-dependent reductase (Old Yellow Enzyme family)/thioredoxin reductase
MSDGCQDFPHMFAPGVIGTLPLKNRVTLAATSTELADADGFVTDAMVAFYAERAKGGTGLLVVEATYVDQPGKRLRFNSMLHEDRYIPGMRRLVDAIHEGGAKAALQIAHGGRESRPEITGHPTVAPSAIPSEYTSVGEPARPREMTPHEIRDLVQSFVEAAARAYQAGFDAVELHGAHGYLIGQFLSPVSNKREDAYGGTTEKRTRFYVEILQGIKARIGNDFPVICRMNGSDKVPLGLEIDEAVQIAELLAQAGADAISVSAGIHASRPYAIIPGMSGPRGCYASLAAAVKSRVRVPVMAVGRINTPFVAEKIIADGDADYVCLSRALIADPYFTAKAQTDDLDSIVPCIACNECVASVHRHHGVSCTMNPMASRELDYRDKLQSHPEPRRIVVVGAGVAGMAAALTAVRRGHETHLIERSQELGGQLLLAHRPPHREELENALHYFTRSIHNEGVRIHLGREWSAAEIAALSPDHVIVSTGAESRLPSIPGIDQPHVIFGWQVIAGTRQAGKTCVVIGGGLVGIEVADFLAHRDHTVIIVARSGLLSKAVWADHVYFLDRVRDLGIVTMPNTKVHEIGSTWVDVEPVGQARHTLTDIDTVIVCTGYEPRDAIGGQLQQQGLDVRFAGDVLGSRKFFQAVEEGTLAALDV